MLVVEDDEVLHHLVAAMVDEEAAELVFESDGAAALDRIRAVGPDLVLMDVLLPGADGVDLTQRMKNMPELAAIPVVMFTAKRGWGRSCAAWKPARPTSSSSRSRARRSSPS